MNFYKRILMFYLGGSAYMSLEFLWRGRSSGSMFLLGGTCFLLLGKLDRLSVPRAAKAVPGAMLVTVLELLTGLAVNRDHSIWDYRRLPLNFHGQICLPYTLLWIPLSYTAMVLYKKAVGWIDNSLPFDKMKKRNKEGSL